MKLKIYQIDAFTDHIFSGNSAAVCPLTSWISDDIMQKIAMENNLSETVFYVKNNNQYEIRWFTPTVEIDLCGHATLAAAYVLFNFENYSADVVHFYSPRSGALSVAKKDDFFTLNFPVDVSFETHLTPEISACFNTTPIAVYKARTDYMIVFETEEQIKHIVPNFDEIAKLKSRGVMITAKGNQVDFVSRFFAPQSGINEDPVTGSAHTTLTPYWTKRLNKTELTAIQLSDRKGYLQCKLLNDHRVEISGKGKLYLIGEIYLE